MSNIKNVHCPMLESEFNKLNERRAELNLTWHDFLMTLVGDK